MQTCRHCREKAQYIEAELRELLRDASVPRQTRMSAFRAIVRLRIDELAPVYRQRDLTTLGDMLTRRFRRPRTDALDAAA